MGCRINNNKKKKLCYAQASIIRQFPFLDLCGDPPEVAEGDEGEEEHEEREGVAEHLQHATDLGNQELLLQGGRERESTDVAITWLPFKKKKKIAKPRTGADREALVLQVRLLRGAAGGHVQVLHQLPGGHRPTTATAGR